MSATNDIWVFAYGSLMWRPDFDFVEQRPALLSGYHRALCIYSFRYRGKPERPGLVLGLDRGGSCRGKALRVEGSKAATVLDYLVKREMVTGVYRQAWLPVQVGAEKVSACAFVVERGHEQYTGKLSIERTAELILQGEGMAGTALDYLRNTVAHLDELGITEGLLHDVLETAERLEKAR
jgi:cation transport protein ChaC